MATFDGFGSLASLDPPLAYIASQPAASRAVVALRTRTACVGSTTTRSAADGSQQGGLVNRSWWL